MGVPRNFDQATAAYPDAHMWCSEEMVTADMAFAMNFHAILSHRVAFITGQAPASLHEVFARCKDKDYDAC